MRPLFLDSSTKHSPVHHKYPLWLVDKLGLCSSISKPFTTKSTLFGGATPISMCLEAKQFINTQRSNCIAIMIVNRPNSPNRNEYVNHYSDEFKSGFDELS